MAFTETMLRLSPVQPQSFGRHDGGPRVESLDLDHFGIDPSAYLIRILMPTGFRVDHLKLIAEVERS